MVSSSKFLPIHVPSVNPSSFHVSFKSQVASAVFLVCISLACFYFTFTTVTINTIEVDREQSLLSIRNYNTTTTTPFDGQVPLIISAYTSGVDSVTVTVLNNLDYDQRSLFIHEFFIANTSFQKIISESEPTVHTTYEFHSHLKTLLGAFATKFAHEFRNSSTSWFHSLLTDDAPLIINRIKAAYVSNRNICHEESDTQIRALFYNTTFPYIFPTVPDMKRLVTNTQFLFNQTAIKAGQQFIPRKWVTNYMLKQLINNSSRNITAGNPSIGLLRPTLSANSISQEMAYQTSASIVREAWFNTVGMASILNGDSTYRIPLSRYTPSCLKAASSLFSFVNSTLTNKVDAIVKSLTNDAWVARTMHRSILLEAALKFLEFITNIFNTLFWTNDPEGTKYVAEASGGTSQSLLSIDVTLQKPNSINSQFHTIAASMNAESATSMQKRLTSWDTQVMQRSIDRAEKMTNEKPFLNLFKEVTGKSIISMGIDAILESKAKKLDKKQLLEELNSIVKEWEKNGSVDDETKKKYTDLSKKTADELRELSKNAAAYNKDYIVKEIVKNKPDANPYSSAIAEASLKTRSVSDLKGILDSILKNKKTINDAIARNGDPKGLNKDEAVESQAANDVQEVINDEDAVVKDESEDVANALAKQLHNGDVNEGENNAVLVENKKLYEENENIMSQVKKLKESSQDAILDVQSEGGKNVIENSYDEEMAERKRLQEKKGVYENNEEDEKEEEDNEEEDNKEIAKKSEGMHDEIDK